MLKVVAAMDLGRVLVVNWRFYLPLPPFPPFQSVTELSGVLEADLLGSISSAFIDLYEQLVGTLRQSCSPGRKHYHFSFMHIQAVMQVRQTEA